MNLSIELILALTSIVSSVIAITVLRNLFTKKEYSIDNAIPLLKNGFPEAWNELRIKNPNWQPTIKNERFYSINLDNVNLSGCNIKDTDFVKVSLIGATFTNSNLNRVKFTDDSNLDNVLFKDSNLFQVSFSDLSFNGSLIQNSNLKVVTFENTETKDLQIISSNLDIVQGIEDVEIKKSNLIQFNTDYSSYNAIEFFERATEFEIANFIKVYFEYKGYNNYIDKEAEGIGIDLLLSKQEVWGTENIAVVIKKIPETESIKSSILNGLRVIGDTWKMDRVLLVTNLEINAFSKVLLEQDSKIRVIGKNKLIEFYNELVRNN